MYKTQTELKNELTHKLMLVVIAIGSLLFVGMIVYHFSEKWSFLDSLYFSAISLTSRGFSEMRPSNWFSTLFSIVYLFIGMAIVIFSISSLVSFYNKTFEHRIKNKIKKIQEKKSKKKSKWVLLR